MFLSGRRAFKELVDVVELSQDTMLLHGLHEQGFLVGWTRLRLRTLVLVAWATKPHSTILPALSVSLSDELGRLLNPDDVLVGDPPRGSLGASLLASLWSMYDHLPSAFLLDLFLILVGSFGAVSLPSDDLRQHLVRNMPFGPQDLCSVALRENRNILLVGTWWQVTQIAGGLPLN